MGNTFLKSLCIRENDIEMQNLMKPTMKTVNDKINNLNNKTDYLINNMDNTLTYSKDIKANISTMQVDLINLSVKQDNILSSIENLSASLREEKEKEKEKENEKEKEKIRRTVKRKYNYSEKPTVSKEENILKDNIKHHKPNVIPIIDSKPRTSLELSEDSEISEIVGLDDIDLDDDNHLLFNLIND